jgi:hypothetical protein
MRARITVVMAWALAVVLGGCAQTATGTTGTASADADQAWLRLTACIRANGMPDWPDPTRGPDGQLGFPADSPHTTPRVQYSCRSQFAQLPATAETGTPMPVDIPAALRFAACLRAHGFPHWPDPDADGRYQLSQVGAPNIAIKRVLTNPPAPCRVLVPLGGIRVS